jgi:hypothetical protein
MDSHSPNLNDPEFSFYRHPPERLYNLLCQLFQQRQARVAWEPNHGNTSTVIGWEARYVGEI